MRLIKIGSVVHGFPRVWQHEGAGAALQLGKLSGEWDLGNQGGYEDTEATGPAGKHGG